MKTNTEYAYIVLGDIGRSPRMCNHIKEQLKDDQSNITLLCYVNNDIPPELEDDKISIEQFSMRLLLISKIFPQIIYFLFRIIFEQFQLIKFLFTNRHKKFEYIVLQNPPCFYLLWIIQIYKLLTKCKVIVDIHNYGYTLMKINKNQILNILKFLEFFWIRLVSDIILVVSKSMQQDLQKKWKFKNILVLYDQINVDKFKVLSLKEEHEFLNQFNEFSEDDGTIKTQIKDDQIIERQDRPLILISNSSYSIDDDFDQLYEACKQYEQDKKLQRNIILIFTGSGDYKKYWFNKFDKLQSNKIQIYFKWFDHIDYPQICSIADYGICLHKSTSGVDLPIKILDLFACKTPVIAYEYSNTLSELVKRNKNGFVFKDEKQLYDVLCDVIKGKKLKENFSMRTWQQEYNKLRQKMNEISNQK